VGLHRSFDLANIAAFAARGESRCRSAGSGAARAPHAVDEVLGHLRKIVIHHVSDVIDVNAAGGHVGCHQNPVMALLESSQRLIALALRTVSVDSRCVKAGSAQAPG
jgi:hypothetical protein